MYLQARMRCAGGWQDVTICNVSSRGLMAKSRAVPERGAFVEVRHGSVCIVGQVRWAYGARFGIRSQDKIDILGLMSGRQAPAGTKGQERRAAVRPRAPAPSPELAAEASRRFARAFNWGVIAVAVCVAGVMMTEVAGKALREPLARVSLALGGGAGRP